MSEHALIYSAPNCSACNSVKNLFLSKGLKYIEYDISKDAEARKEMIKYSAQMSVPVIVYKGRVFVGFRPLSLKKILEIGY